MVGRRAGEVEGGAPPPGSWDRYASADRQEAWEDMKPMPSRSWEGRGPPGWVESGWSGGCDSAENPPSTPLYAASWLWEDDSGAAGSGDEAGVASPSPWCALGVRSVVPDAPPTTMPKRDRGWGRWAEAEGVPAKPPRTVPTTGVLAATAAAELGRDTALASPAPKSPLAVAASADSALSRRHRRCSGASAGLWLWVSSCVPKDSMPRGTVPPKLALPRARGRLDTEGGGRRGAGLRRTQ